MDKLSKEEVEKLVVRHRIRISPLRLALLQLEPGEGLRIVKGKDWKMKGSPYRIANDLEKSSSLRFKKYALADGSGWVIQRVG